jgi:catechol 2,3-dioxygenase-like lactoylglutathione lyase family enzyme
MTACIAQLTLDAHDPARQAAFWSRALGMAVVAGDDGAAKLYPTPGAAPGTPTIWLQPSPTPKCEKLRLHIDLRPLGGATVDAEVDRLIELGARRADVGQSGSEDFTVLSDPEGSEFCVLHRDPGSQT